MFASRSPFLVALLFIAMSSTVACGERASLQPVEDADFNVGEHDAGGDTLGDDVSSGEDASLGEDAASDLDATPGSDVNGGDDAGGVDGGEADAGDDVMEGDLSEGDVDLDVADEADVDLDVIEDTGPDVDPGMDVIEDTGPDVDPGMDVIEDTGPDVDPGDPDLTCQEDFGAADACGGDLVGTWSVEDVCTDVDFEALIGEFCTGTTVNSLDIESTGTLVYTATTYASAVSVDVETTFTVPSSLCTLGGCGFLADQIEDNLDGAEATCTGPNFGPCNCTVRLSVSGAASGTYTSDNGVITTDDGSTFYYCVDGRVLSQRQFGDDVEFGITQVFSAE